MTIVGIVFPGQGSQSVGMLTTLGDAHAVVRETFAEASETLGFDIWKLVQDGPSDALDDTRNTQPALLAAGVAVWRVWRAQGGVVPAIAAGHSLGEYSALVCADAITFSDAVRLVATRARLMQEAVPRGQGAMAAILGLEDEQVQTICAAAADGEVVEAVNFNAPGQVVIAGHTNAITRACQLAKAAGAKRALPLSVSVPSHCALMRPAAEQLTKHLARVDIKQPQIPVIHNAAVETTTNPERIRALLALQLYNPVRWVETVNTMGTQGINILIEAGPGKVLTGLNKRISKSIRTLPIFDTQTLDQALKETTCGG